MRELVGALPDQSWAIVTACPRDLALARIVAGGYPRPAVLVTFEDVARGKPDPQGYLLAAGKLGAEPSRCLVVEDSPAGVAAARAAGMAVVGLSTTHDATDLRVADAIVPDARWLRVRRASRGMSLTRLTALRSPDTVDERGGVGR
jgi:sugar-phosphatase